MAGMIEDQGSFRDPSGRVFRAGDEIFRTVSSLAKDHYEYVKSTGVLNDLIKRSQVVDTAEVDATAFKNAPEDTFKVLKHEKIPFVSYPYEWSFPLLKDAALLHLNIQIEALNRGVSFSDATAYNVQFKGINPVFIDTLSMREYREGELWSGHKQFCEQFLNPLLLRSMFGIPHNSWFRGNLEGIETEKFANLIPWWKNFSINVLTHITMQARMQRNAVGVSKDAMDKAQSKGLSKNAYIHILHQLRDWIAKLQPKDTGSTVWQDYEQTHTYNSEEEEAKRRFIGEFCDAVRPEMILDFGCNSGEYSEVALSSGAKRSIGFDFDQGALERAYARAKAKGMDFLPLYLDAANPSPSQGWNSEERSALNARDKADALIALAFEHHLTIGRNIPMDRMVDWLTSFASTGVIEFVQKSDPTVQQLLMLREDIFDDYNEENFVRCLQASNRIVKKERVASTGRTLFWYERI
ncbi:MAG: class I SAM-dependent methyltransferase [Pseudomonadota bacterium]